MSEKRLIIFPTADIPTPTNLHERRQRNWMGPDKRLQSELYQELGKRMFGVTWPFVVTTTENALGLGVQPWHLEGPTLPYTRNEQLDLEEITQAARESAAHASPDEYVLDERVMCHPVLCAAELIGYEVHRQIVLERLPSESDVLKECERAITGHLTGADALMWALGQEAPILGKYHRQAMQEHLEYMTDHPASIGFEDVDKENLSSVKQRLEQALQSNEPLYQYSFARVHES